MEGYSDDGSDVYGKMCNNDILVYDGMMIHIQKKVNMIKNYVEGMKREKTAVEPIVCIKNLKIKRHLFPIVKKRIDEIYENRIVISLNKDEKVVCDFSGILLECDIIDHKKVGELEEAKMMKENMILNKYIDKIEILVKKAINKKVYLKCDRYVLKEIDTKEILWGLIGSLFFWPPVGTIWSWCFCYAIKAYKRPHCIKKFYEDRLDYIKSAIYERTKQTITFRHYEYLSLFERFMHAKYTDRNNTFPTCVGATSDYRGKEMYGIMLTFDNNIKEMLQE